MTDIATLHLFPPLKESLLALLKGLTPAQWVTPSPIPDRTVKDLASHLLDTIIRRLSIQRDSYSCPPRLTFVTVMS